MPIIVLGTRARRAVRRRPARRRWRSSGSRRCGASRSPGFGYAIALKTGNPAAVNSSFLLFFPFLFLTSSYVPRDQLSGWLDTVSAFNPVTYILDGLRSLVLADSWQWGDLAQGVGRDRGRGCSQHGDVLRGAARTCAAVGVVRSLQRMPRDPEPPELARLIDFAERPRVAGLEPALALVRYAQPEPQRVNDLLDVVRRVEWALGEHAKDIQRDGPEIWDALQGTGPDPDVVALLRVAQELDGLGDTLATWAVDRAGDRPDAEVDRVTTDVAHRARCARHSGRRPKRSAPHPSANPGLSRQVLRRRDIDRARRFGARVEVGEGDNVGAAIREHIVADREQLGVRGIIRPQPEHSAGSEAGRQAVQPRRRIEGRVTRMQEVSRRVIDVDEDRMELRGLAGVEPGSDPRRGRRSRPRRDDSAGLTSSRRRTEVARARATRSPRRAPRRRTASELADRSRLPARCSRDPVLRPRRRARRPSSPPARAARARLRRR